MLDIFDMIGNLISSYVALQVQSHFHYVMNIVCEFLRRLKVVHVEEGNCMMECNTYFLVVFLLNEAHQHQSLDVI